MISEPLDNRVLAAIRFVDAATDLPITAPLKVTAEGVRVIRNRRGLHVVTAAPGFEDYAATFKTPTTVPSPVTLHLTAEDPADQYLGRVFPLDLPRSTSTDSPLPSDSVFTPVDVSMYPSSLAIAAPGSAIVRLRVVNANGNPLAGALVSLSLDSPSLTRRGLSDWRGEAVVIIPGIPTANWGGDVVSNQFTLTLQAAYDAAAGPLPDPDALAALLQDLTDTVDVASGQEVSQTIELEWITVP